MKKEEFKGMKYETVTRRALGILIEDADSPAMADLRNLYWYEDPAMRHTVRHLPIEVMRGYVRDALQRSIDAVAQWPLGPEARATLAAAQRCLATATSADEFYEVVTLLDAPSSHTRSRDH